MGSFNKTNRRVFCTKNFKRQIWWSEHNENVLGIETTPPTLERSFKAVTKVKAALPTDLEMECIPIVLS